MNPNFYRFESTWRLRAPSADVYAVLEAVEHYPDWWPEIREARRVGDGSGYMRARSFLPYDLNFSLTRTRQDPRAGILEARLEGDLEGFSRWSLTQIEDATVADFHEEVVVNRTLLRRLALVARPAFQLNHRLMMRHGHRGLQTYLAGYGRATARARAS
ncbi:MAG: SRPBCC family protein [Actinomycetota bacterium]